ncbi:hypothetical protein IAI18_05260 [Acetobacteraceae bacterium H6797]|nr:hypothetical protein [Acetobacteraceae bacterium H6797]
MTVRGKISTVSQSWRIVPAYTVAVALGELLSLANPAAAYPRVSSASDIIQSAWNRTGAALTKAVEKERG